MSIAIFQKKNSTISPIICAPVESSIVYQYGTSNVSSDVMRYIPTSAYSTRAATIDGYTVSSNRYTANTYNYLDNPGTDTIYKAAIENAFNSIASTEFDGAQTIQICSQNGTSLYDFTISTNPASVSIDYKSNTYYVGNAAISLSGATPNTIKVKFVSLAGNENNIAVAIYCYTDGTSSQNHIATFSITSFYIEKLSQSVIYYLSDPVGSASGSDVTDYGVSSGFGLYDFPSSDIDPENDIDISASGASPAISAGLVNPYYVTASEIASLGNFLWSSDFFDSIAKTFSNPMDCIISLSSFPLASSSMSLGSSESVRVGNTTSSSTGTRLISEFVTIDCGTVSVPEVWGSYLDYAQTKLYIYIPYLGIEELPLCECMGGSVACKLRINLLTGALVACLTLTSGTYVTGSARVQPIYFSTTCKSDIPVSGATTGALAGAFQLLGGAVSSVAGIATGVAPLAISGLASAAQGVATMQSQNSQISGAVGAAGGQMAHKIPFLIFDRPVQSVPANLASVAGYQSNSGTTLSRCSGYVICDTINLDGLALTRSELEEVEQICTSGVYIS